MRVTKSHLAKRVVREVEEVLVSTIVHTSREFPAQRLILFIHDTANKLLLAYFNETLIKEVSFQDLFLVDLVQTSKGTFQPTIALRVAPAHKT